MFVFYTSKYRSAKSTLWGDREPHTLFAEILRLIDGLAEASTDMTPNFINAVGLNRRALGPSRLPNGRLLVPDDTLDAVSDAPSGSSQAAKPG